MEANDDMSLGRNFKCIDPFGLIVSVSIRILRFSHKSSISELVPIVCTTNINVIKKLQKILKFYPERIAMIAQGLMIPLY